MPNFSSRRARGRPHGRRSGSSLRWSRAGRYRSSRRRETGFSGGDGSRPQRILLRGRVKGGAALAHDLPGRQIAANARRRADFLPDRRARSSRGSFIRRSAPLIVTLRRCGNANIHSISPLMTPRIGGHRMAASKRKCAFRMRGTRSASHAGHQRGRRSRRHSEDDDIVGAELDGVVAEVSAATRFPANEILCSSCSKLTSAPLSFSCLIAGSTSTVLSPSRAISGRQALAAGEQRLAHDGAGKPRRSLRRLDVERREQQRPHQLLIQRALAGDRWSIRSEFRAGPEQRHQREIVERPGVRARGGACEKSRTGAAAVEPQRPALSGRRDRRTQIARSPGPTARPRCRSIAHRPSHAGCPTARGDCRCRSTRSVAASNRSGSGRRPAGLPRAGATRLARIGEPDRCCKAGDPGADDVDGSLHQMNA